MSQEDKAPNLTIWHSLNHFMAPEFLPRRNLTIDESRVFIGICLEF